MNFFFFGNSNVVQYQVVYCKNKDRLKVKMQVKSDHVSAKEMVLGNMKEKFNYENIDIVFTEEFDKTTEW